MVQPRRRIRDDGPPGDGYFYPREALEILGVAGLDYAQLRRVFVIAREQAGFGVRPGRMPACEPTRGEWARFSLLDIAAARVLIRLASAPPGSGRATSRLQLEPVRRACQALRSVGFDNPLLDVPMERNGRKVLAFINGDLIDPVSGQHALDLAFDRTRGFLEDAGLADAELRERVARDAQRLAGPMLRP